MVPMRKALPFQFFLYNADCYHNRSSQRATRRGSARTVSSGPIKMSRMEVSVRTDHERNTTSQMSRADPFIVTEITKPQGDYKAQEVTLDGDLESRQEK